MIPCVSVKVKGTEYFPLYNVKAYFRIQEYGDDVLERISESSEEGFKLASELFRILCEEGEAARVNYGYDAGNVPDIENLMVEYTPADIITIKNAVFAAVTLGYGQEVPSTDDIDLTLLEVQKKKENKQE